MRKIYLLSFCFLYFLKIASAQQNNTKLISGSFQKATISQFVSELESKSSYHFYYDATQFDSLRVTLEVTDKPIETILDMAFKNTDFHYAITPQQQVFLTKGRQIKTELAAGFLGASALNAQNKPATVIEEYKDDEKAVPEATTENKLYEIGIKTNNIKAGNAILSGYIRNIKSGEAVI
jgi:hypothetical protein